MIETKEDILRLVNFARSWLSNQQPSDECRITTDQYRMICYPIGESDIVSFCIEDIDGHMCAGYIGFEDFVIVDDPTEALCNKDQCYMLDDLPYYDEFKSQVEEYVDRISMNPKSEESYKLVQELKDFYVKAFRELYS